GAGRLRVERSGGRLAFGGAGGLRQAGLDHEPVAVLGELVAHVAELGLLALAFAEQACLRVGDRGVCRFDRFCPWKSTSSLRPLLSVSVLCIGAASCGVSWRLLSVGAGWGS